MFENPCLTDFPLTIPEPLDYLKILPSYECGRNCFYCYNDALSQQCLPREINLLNTLHAITRAQKGPFVAEILGGEPLHKNNIDRTKKILQLLKESEGCNKRVIATAVSHPQIISDILRYVELMYLSVDISHSKHNKKRLSIRKLDNLSNLSRKRGVDLSLSVVLYGDETVDDLIDFVLNARSLGIPIITFGYISFHEHTDSNFQKYRDLFYFLFTLRYALEGEILLSGNILDTLDLAVRGLERTKICHCGESSVVVLPDGRITPSICFGNDNNISQTQYINWKKDRILFLESSGCLGCELWKACRGGCMGASVFLCSSHLERDHEFCSLLSSVWEKISKDTQ